MLLLFYEIPTYLDVVIRPSTLVVRFRTAELFSIIISSFQKYSRVHNGRVVTNKKGAILIVADSNLSFDILERYEVDSLIKRFVFLFNS